MSATAEVRPDSTVVLVKGGDPVLVGDAVRATVDVLVGSEDPGLAMEEVGAERLVGSDGSPSIGPLVDAAQTPPFLTARRVVVGRGLAAFGTAGAVAPLVAYLAEPLASTALVLVWERAADQQRSARIPKSLQEAVTAAGGVVVDADPGKVGPWVQAQLREAPISVDAAAAERIAEHVGDEAASLGGVIDTLVGAYGAGAQLGVDEVEPYLLGAGALPPWALTDAIDRGSVREALAVLERSLEAGGRHPLQIMAILHTHVGRMLALDGARVPDERAAAELLGMKGSTFPARKALAQARRLGHDKIAELTQLLARADLDLRGARAWPPEVVMEVLVARLASRSGRGRRG